MAKFKQVRSKVKAPTSAIKTSTIPTTRTALGGVGYTHSTKGELYLLAVSNFVGVDLFHEKAAARDDRFEKLVHTVAVADPEWTLHFVTWLRKGGNMRSASLVAGAEAARALIGAGNTDGWARKLVSAPLQRADEPGQMLAYMARYSEVKAGKALKLPKPFKRGIADAVRRLYTEFNYLKWSSKNSPFPFADVIELVHPIPDPGKPYQGQLFKHAVDERHNRPMLDIPHLRVIQSNNCLRQEGTIDPRVWLDTARLKAAGMTWEDAMSAVGSKLPKKDVWEAMIPNMGVFAVVRNLRNFTDAGISNEVRNAVAKRLDNPVEIRESMMFPFRFLAAYKANKNNLQWAYPLEQALNHSLSNVPSLPGRTLILVDRSGSMFGNISAATDLDMADQAAIFGTALALRAEKADLIQFGSTSGPILFKRSDSILALLKQFTNLGGTDTRGALARYFAKHDRVVIITDEQHSAWGGGDWVTQIVGQAPVYTWNLQGYRAAQTAGGPNRHWFGGLTDASFSTIPLLEAGTDSGWPWETAPTEA